MYKCSVILFIIWIDCVDEKVLIMISWLQKQVTDVSLVLKDSDMNSENLSSLILLSVSDGQKTDSSKVVSFIGI